MKKLLLISVSIFLSYALTFADGSNGGHISTTCVIVKDSTGVNVYPNFNNENTGCTSGVEINLAYETSGNSVRFIDSSNINVTNGDFDIYWQIHTPELFVNSPVVYHTKTSTYANLPLIISANGIYTVTLYYQRWYDAQNGCELETGINEVKQGNAIISVYNRELTINSEAEIKQVQILNISGQLIAEFKVNTSRETFSLTDLSKGIYIVSVMGANKAVINKKILIL